jgi:NAD-dependent SIR2 family protein deacetylase
MRCTVSEAARSIREAEGLLITAGAGMGVDSGLPDFRGNEGFWKAYPAAARLGLSFAEMACPDWFENEPRLAWAFYGHRLNLYRRTVPHEGFARLLAWAKEKPDGYFVFTSNVDGHFQKAGFDAERIVECHGSIHHFQCVDGCHDGIWEAEKEQVNVDEAAFRAIGPLPGCRHCGGMARPNILMFGDAGWLAHRHHAQQQRFARWITELAKKSARLAVIELGAGTAIPTVRMLSETIVERLEGSLVRINPREPGVPTGHFGLELGARAGLRQLEEAAG